MGRLSDKGVDDSDPVIVLSVVEVLGDQLGGSGGASGGHDQCIPEGNLPSGLLDQGALGQCKGVYRCSWVWRRFKGLPPSLSPF